MVFLHGKKKVNFFFFSLSQHHFFGYEGRCAAATVTMMLTIAIHWVISTIFQDIKLQTGAEAEPVAIISGYGLQCFVLQYSVARSDCYIKTSKQLGESIALNKEKQRKK